MRSLPSAKRARQQQAEQDAEQFVANRPRRNAGTGPPSHWGERGNPSRQASLVVDPPDGRIPPMTEEGKKRIAMASSTYWYDFPDAVVQHPFETLRRSRPVRSLHHARRARLDAADGLQHGHTNPSVSRARRDPERDDPRGARYPGERARSHLQQDPQLHGRLDRAREGDSLVIETTNFNARVGLTRNGNTLFAQPGSQAHRAAHASRRQHDS